MTNDLVPKWLREVNPNSCLSVRDMKKMIGISGQAFVSRVSRGDFPEPDWIRGNTKYWRVKTIIKYLGDESRIVVVTENNGLVKQRVI